MLSNYYRDIQLFRFSDRSDVVYMLASDELQVVVFPNGIWEFIND